MAFSTLIGLLLAVASVFFIYPFIAGRGSSGIPAIGDSQQANVEIFRDQEAQLARQLEAGEINESQHQQLLTEAQQLLLHNTAAEPADGQKSQASTGFWLLPLLLVLLIAGTLVSYNQLGATADEKILELMEQGADLTEDSAAEISWRQSLNAVILQRVKQRPDNIYYWAMLAQGALVEGDVLAASQYFAAAIEVTPEDGFLLAQYAESLYLVAGNRFTEPVIGAMDRAFAVDSNNPTILGLKGIQSFENAQLQLAITYWQGAIQGLDSNSPTARALQQGIDRANSLLGKPAGAESGTTITVQLSLAPGISFAPTQMVFVAAVRTSGSAMPLAAQKLTAADLPVTVTLSDSQALMAGQSLSSVDQIKLIARLSTTGSATPQSGDWEIQSEVIELSDISGPVALQINSQRP
ncbi:MAG: c-type cytochrome biogenesis protein CcmI [Porticoccaceae bacterium]